MFGENKFIIRKKTPKHNIYWINIHNVDSHTFQNWPFHFWNLTFLYQVKAFSDISCDLDSALSWNFQDLLFNVYFELKNVCIVIEGVLSTSPMFYIPYKYKMNK